MLSEKAWQRGTAAGFSLIELLIAVVILLVGVVAVAELVPRAMETNYRNRYDSSGLILAQRQLEQMMARDLRVGAPAVSAEYTFTMTWPDGTTSAVNMGLNNPTGTCGAVANCTEIGANTVSLATGATVIDWTQAPGGVTAGYSATFAVPGPTAGETHLYEARWNVRTRFGIVGGVVRPIEKRLIVSTRGRTPFPLGPATLVTVVGMRP